MGNTSQCGIFSNIDHQFQYLGEQNHFLFGQIKHFKNQKDQNQHFAIKKLKFPSQIKLKEFQQFIQFYQNFCGTIRLIQANQYVNPNSKKKSPKTQGLNAVIDQKQSFNPVFYCNKENFLFTSQSQELSCSQPSFYMTLHLDYLEEKSCLKTILKQKIDNLAKATQNSKINQNILLQLQNKVKLCEYHKIDKLPQKERSVINLFFNEIQVLRIFDCMLTALYGLRLNGIEVEAVRPELFFRPLQQNDELSYFPFEVINKKQMGNFQKSYQTMKRWLIQQNAKFHHNWTVKQKQLVSYLHPDNLEKLIQMLLTEGENNFVTIRKSSRKDLEKQNIFAMGLIILEICLLEPYISSKIYNISTCRKEEKHLPSTKKQMKYSFHKQNLTIKLNHSALQKYLIQMKTRYSESFEELIETMIFGCSFNETAKLSNSDSKDHSISYEQIIERLQGLIEENIQNLKSVYSTTNKSKSKSKHTTQKNSRNSSLSRQVSSSGVSNQSLSLSSSLSMLPVQSQQKVLSIKLLKKHCEKLENKVDQVLVKSELQTMKEPFVKRQQKLEQLISKDEERILSQLNKLNNQKPSMQKQQRFNYRRDENNKESNVKKLDESFPKSINPTIPSEQFLSYKLNVPSSLQTKNQTQSQEKRMNSTTKTKKIFLQKAREEQSLGSSVCQTINFNKSKRTDQMNDSQNSINSQTINGNVMKIELKKTQMAEKDISAFEQDPIQNFSSKSELKNLISLKKKRSNLGVLKDQSSFNIITEEKEVKELKSRELYEIYMKEYNNLLSSQRLADP